MYTNDALDLLALDDAESSFFGEFWFPMLMTLLLVAFGLIGPILGLFDMLFSAGTFHNLIDELIFSRHMVFFFILLMGLYILPSIVAYLRGKMVLPLLNFAIGFTIIGWIGMLVFAFKGENKRKA